MVSKILILQPEKMEKMVFYLRVLHLASIIISAIQGNKNVFLKIF